METEEDYAALLRDTLEGCDIETDLDTLDRIADSLKLLQQERNNKVQTTNYELRQLSAKLTEKQEIYDSLIHSKQRDELKNKIKQVQSSELELKKNLKELTSAKQDLSTQLSNLVDEFNDLDKQIEELDLIHEDDDKDAAMYVFSSRKEKKEKRMILSTNVIESRLKLMVYRKLGIKIDLKSSLLIIYNKQKNMTDFLKYEDDKYSDYFISNYIWDRF